MTDVGNLNIVELWCSCLLFVSLIIIVSEFYYFTMAYLIMPKELAKILAQVNTDNVLATL